MSIPTAFDNNKYLEEQTAEILKRAEMSDNKLYLEFGGKLLYDYHASRVLPGYDANVKMRLLQQLKDKADILLCIFAGDIERKKIRADFGITYDSDALKMIDDLRQWGIGVFGVVITRFDKQPSVVIFKNGSNAAASGFTPIVSRKAIRPTSTLSSVRADTEPMNT